MATKKKMLQAAAGQAGGAGLDITDVFSTYLYDGTGAAQTITNGIDLSGEGGLVWLKNRVNTFGVPHIFYDTNRGVEKALQSNSTNAEFTNTSGEGLQSFNSDGFSLGNNYYGENINEQPVASWTFRKAPKFFDVVTYSGNGSNSRTISHNLGSVPGMIMIKRLDSATDWMVYHRGVNGGTNPANYYLTLNGTDPAYETASPFNNTVPTSSVFSVGGSANTNHSSGTYVAYLFAHNDGDGEFGPDGDADIIKCGSYSQSSASDVDVDLGFEPQFVIVKRSDDTSQWYILDEMRGFLAGSNSTSSRTLYASLANAEADFTIQKTATGFTWPSGQYGSGTQEYIYIAIRRGPLAQPESATDVFSMAIRDTSKPHFNATSSHVDMAFKIYQLSGYGDSWKKYIQSRLTGTKHLLTNSTDPEGSNNENTWDHHNGWSEDPGSEDYFSYMWKRAPGFFDVVAYTGDLVAGRTVSHNLGVAPEMIWVKSRTEARNWHVWHSSFSSAANDFLYLDSTMATETTVPNMWGTGLHTDTDFIVGAYNGVNRASQNYIAYLFATLPGVSKVGSYTGTGATLNIDCGFTSGARFVLIKCSSDGLSDWHVMDSTRGIVAGNDPFLYLNNTTAEDTGEDMIDPYSSGFALAANNRVNTSGSTYIFYAIA